MIIPVIDLMHGQVVQAVRGERERYRPLSSILTPATEPLPVAQALQAATGCHAFYVADLDAIQDQGLVKGHQAAIHTLAAALDAELWVDAGVTDVPAARRVLATGAGRVIVGSETLPDLETLRALQVALPEGHRLFSLDLVAGRVLSRAPALQGRAPLDVLDVLVREGWSQVIVLTLDRVGTGSSLDWALLRAMRQAHPTLTMIAGGGVRTIDDVRRLEALGVDGVLVASALHRGWITRKDLRA